MGPYLWLLSNILRVSKKLRSNSATAAYDDDDDVVNNKQ